MSLVVLGWSVLSNRLALWNITGPLVFMLAGFVLGNPSWGLLAIEVEAPSIHVLAELTLAMLLFSDASRVNISLLRHDIGLPARLLGVGLPLSVIVGSVLAAVLFKDFTWALAVFVGAALAPTDAALSAQVIDDKRLPTRIRRALNVESGLNDGIVTPVVVFALAIAASEHGESSDDRAGGAILELAIGVVLGLALGFISALLITFASHRHWVLHGGRRLGTLATAVGSFSFAQILGGNGFIAAFVAGIAFGATFPRDFTDVREIGELPELLGEVLALGVWFLFGAALVPAAIEHASLSATLYAILSLTAVRMIPVALGLVGTRLDRETVLFLGWFGPRGLASMVFALLAVEELDQSDEAGQAISVVVITVLLSVCAHGLSAGPLGRRYARNHGDTIPTGDVGLRSRGQSA